jgi:hypothetical protein
VYIARLRVHSGFLMLKIFTSTLGRQEQRRISGTYPATSNCGKSLKLVNIIKVQNETEV